MNGEYRGESDIGRLMHDFNCTDAADMNFELMAERTKYLKENPEGVNRMCKVIEEMRREEREEGLREGMEQNRTANIAALMKNLSVSVEKAMELLGIPAGERDALAKKIKV